MTIQDWTSGYVADIGYTYGYYTELNPLRVKLAFLNNGLVFPEFGTACELGFGQGVSVNIHAAASMTEWYGTDFNPAQAGFAQELAAVSGSKAKLYDDSFADFTQRKDLPDFDYIGLHGIWSWISDENRSVIVEFLSKKLKAGGVLYISYNTMPGWAAFAPIRHLMTGHADVIGADGHGIVKRIDGAIEFAEKLLATNPIYAKVNPIIKDRVAKLKDQNRHYQAHEYFNQDWHPMHIADMAEWLKPAKLDYACSANYLDHINAINVTAEQQSFLNDIPDAMFRQSVRDFMVNQQFRKDYWVKGARKLSALENAEALRHQKVILVNNRQNVSLKIIGALGEAIMSETINNPILDILADHKPKTIAQLEQSVAEKGINFGQLTQAIMVLSGAGHLEAVQDDAVIGKSKKHTDKLNSYIISKARNSSDISYLASPVIAGGIRVSRFQQHFLLAISYGKKKPEEMGEIAWSVLVAQGQKIIKDGTMMENPEENLAELSAQAKVFFEKQLPIMKALQII